MFFKLLKNLSNIYIYEAGKTLKREVRKTETVKHNDGSMHIMEETEVYIDNMKTPMLAYTKFEYWDSLGFLDKTKTYFSKDFDRNYYDNDEEYYKDDSGSESDFESESKDFQ